jgi:Protein of unknown function (DUF3040)
LRALERQLRAQDPKFAESFATRARHLRRGDSVSFTIGIVAAVLLGALLLLAGSSGGALGFAAAVGLVWRLQRSVSPLGRTVTNQPIADDCRADPPSGSGPAEAGNETPEGER